MFQFSKWTTVCVFSVVIAARSGVAWADSKKFTRQSSSPGTGGKSSVKQQVVSSPNVQLKTMKSQATSDIIKSKAVAIPQSGKTVNPKMVTSNAVGLMPKQSDQVNQAAVGKIPAMPLANSPAINFDKIKDTMVPLPGKNVGINPDLIKDAMVPQPGATGNGSGLFNPNAIGKLPFSPWGGPNSTPSPVPGAPADPCPPHSHWPTWCWNSPWFWIDFGCSPYPVVPLYSTVEFVEIAAPALDLEFVSVRLVDLGEIEKGLGPQFRVRFRNSSGLAITRPFHVTMLVGNGQRTESLPQVTEPVAAMAAGEVRVLDLRLPPAANQLVIQGTSASLLYPMLSVAIDANQELPESDETNNRATFDRAMILAVEP